jgi:peptidoglycan/LPS O-acetylase OafA/YrhL
MNHYRSIDQLRGLACLMVIMHHIHHPTLNFQWMPPDLRQGWAGVHIFFVISGFVVTLSLMNRLKSSSSRYLTRLKENTAALTDFYKRRFFRLAPSALVVLALIALMFSIFDFVEPATLNRSGRLYEIGRATLEYLIPIYNLHIVGHGFAVPNRLTTAPYWTLSIENQFYLFIPLFLLAFTNRKTLKTLCFSIVVALSLIVRPVFHYFYSGTTPDIINVYYANSLTNFDGLLLGVCLAYLFVERQKESYTSWKLHFRV